MSVRSALERWLEPPDDDLCPKCRRYDDKCECDMCQECGEWIEPVADITGGIVTWVHRCGCGEEW